MKLNELFNAIPDCSFTGNRELEITGISSDSKKIKPGYLFIAKKGRSFDGTKFIDEAFQSGAVAVLTNLNEMYS